MGISLRFAFEKIPHISLHCKLVPVQYQEYEYGLYLFLNSCQDIYTNYHTEYFNIQLIKFNIAYVYSVTWLHLIKFNTGTQIWTLTKIIMNYPVIKRRT